MGSALERLRAIDTTAADKKYAAYTQARQAARTASTSRSAAAASGGTMDRVTTDVAKFQKGLAAKKQTETRIAELTKQLNEQAGSGDMGGTTLLRNEMDRLTRQQKYGNASYENNWGGQTRAKYALTKLSMDASKTANEYLNVPTQNNKEAAEQARKVLKEFQERNKETLAAGAGKSAKKTTLGDSVQSFLAYLPQLGSQTKAGAQGALVGAGAGSVLPGVGTALGAKAGWVAGSAAESYALMRGSAYMDLVELGVDEETARKAASDEAFISALVEMGDTILDVTGVGLGVGSLLNAAKQGVAKALAKEGMEAAAESSAKKLLKLAAKYGLNIGQEYGEEATQQAVSIANRNRLAAEHAGGKTELFGQALKTLRSAATGKDEAAAREIREAGMEGAKIAMISGAAMPVVQTLVGKGAQGVASAAKGGKVDNTTPETARNVDNLEMESDFEPRFTGEIMTGINGEQEVSTTRNRSAGRMVIDPEQFRTEYAKRFPEAGEEQIQEQFEQFKGYAAGQDVVETRNGPMTRAEIKKQLAGLQDEKEINRVVDGLLDEQERQSAVQMDEDLPWIWGEDSTRREPQQTAETAFTNKISEPYAESEVMSNGEEVHLRDGGQRTGSADSGGQVSRLEEGAGGAEGREAESKPADREAAALTYGEKVSTGSLGIPGGSTAKTVRRVTGGETAAVQEARKIAGERGLELVLFGGNNLDVRVKGGQMASARAYIIGKKVFVRADHPVYTAEQLMRHETGHDLIAKGEVDPNQVRQRIRDTHGAEQLDELSRQYAEAYEGSGMTAGEIWEEIICDSLGDMNIFASVETVTDVTGQTELTEQADTANPETEQSRGPPAEGKASIETLENGKKYVRADRQVIFGNDPDDWSEQLEDYINGKIRNGQDIRLVAEDGDVLTLTADTAGKVASFYENGRTMSDESFERKVNAGAHIDELAQVSTRGYDRPKADYNARHGRMASVGWDYRTAFFQDFNGKYYQCTISVSMGEDGNVVYNIGKIKERRFPHALNALNGSSAESGALRGETSSTQTVAQDGGEVNEKTSREPNRRKTAKGQKDMVREIQTSVRKEVAEQRRVTELKHKIQRHAQDLSGELLRPTDKRHIPEDLRGQVALLLEAVNLESGYELEYGKDARYHRVEPGTTLGAEKTKRTEIFKNLKQAYMEIREELVIDPDLLGSGAPGLLDEAMALGEKPVAAMSSKELEIIWKTIRSVEASVRTANRMFAQARFATVSEAAEELRRDNKGKTPKTELNYIGGLQRLAGLDMLTPETFFHQMGDSGEALFRLMRDAQDEHVRIMKAVADFTHKTLDKVDVPTLEKKLHTVTLGGEEVTLSTAQIMELHVLMRREQAHEHILAGGILPKSLPGRGLKKISRPEPVRGITVDELTAAIGVLSEEEAALAEKLQRYASNQLSDYGNRASMEVYNYRKFEEKNYWPIRSNRQEIRSTTEQDTQVTGVANRGFTKTTKPNANTSVVVGSIFDTFANHAAEMATYSAWLGATEDINRIRNYVFRDGEGNRTGTVKGLINRVHGERGADYLQKLLADVANGVKGAHGESDYMGALIGNYKAASVGANLRVIIQQPTALLRALDMLGPQYLISGLGAKGGWEKAKKYAPIAQWKDWGYFDINTGRQMKDVLFDSDSKLGRLKNAAMAPAGAMDSLSWGVLWNAVESETRHKNKELKPDTEEFYKTVAERFTEIVDHTQVVDGILQRSQIMRSADGLKKMATSFMGEPTKQYNMLMAAAYDVTHSTSKERSEAAKKHFARTAFALCVSAVVNAAAQASVDAIRDDDKEKDYWEKWLEAFTGIKGDEESTGEKARNAVLEGDLGNAFNPVGYIPFLKDILSLIQGYDVSRMDMEGISKTIAAAQNMYKTLGGDGKYSLAGATVNLFSEVSRLFGIPFANLKREVESFAMLAAVETNNFLMQYRMEKAMLNPAYSGNSKTFYDILYNASKADPEAHEIIYSDMLKLGYDEKRIKNAMETRMKVEQNVGSVDELSSRYLSPEQIAEYADHGISVDTYAMAYEATRDLKAMEDKEGDTVPNSLGLQIMAAVYSIPGLTNEQVKKLAGDLGAGKSILGYSEKMVNSKLKAMEKRSAPP